MSRFPHTDFWTLAILYVLQILVGAEMNPSETSESKSLIVDVDTGVDDALALTMILGLKHSVKAITVAAGNTDMEKAYENTLRTLEVLNKTNVRLFSLIYSFIHGEIFGIFGTVGRL